MTTPTPDQATVLAAVQKLVDDNGAMLTALQAQLAAETAKDTTDAAAAAAASAALAASQAQLAASVAQVQTLTAEVAALEAELPAEASRRGYTTYTGQWAADDAQYGHVRGHNVARAYFTGLPTALPATILDGRTLSLSYNTSDLPGTLAQVLTTLQGFDPLVPKGTEVDFDPWHEYDHAEASSPQTFISGMAAFTPAVAALKPKLTNIVLRSKAMSTAYLFSGLSAHQPNDFALPATSRPDVFSIDMDGRNSLTAYHDFTPEVTAAVAWAKAQGYTQFAVDELGCERTTADTTGTQRAAWFTAQTAMVVRLVAAAGMTLRYVNLWAYEQHPEYQVTPGSPEAVAWSEQVATA